MMDFQKELVSDNWHFNILFALLMLALVSLPITNWLMLPIAIAMLVNWVSEWNWREKWENVKAHRAVPALFIFTAIYLISLYGLLISANKSAALPAFDCGLWLLVAPLVIFSYKPEHFTATRRKALFTAFIAGCVLHCVLILPFGCYRSLYSGESKYMYYIFLSVFKHPSYVAMYMTFALLLLLKYTKSDWRTMKTWARILVLGAMGLLFLTIILLQSKAGLACLFLITFIWIVYYFAIRRHHPVISIIILAGIVACIIGVYQSGIIRNNRTMDSIEQMKERKEQPYGKGSSEVRITLWKSASEVARESQPWGTGTGDALEDLKLHALEKNYSNLLEHNYNAHCQYIQALIETGIIGLMILLAYCLYPLYYSVRKKNILYFSFALLVILNIAVECMFHTRSGADFIALMNVLMFIEAGKVKN